MTVKPYTINVSQDVLDDLQKRLKRTRWPDQVEGAEWSYGTNLDYLKELIAYWQNGFDWRKQEAELNQFANFTADIDGVNIHFIHERGKGPNPKPLLLLHGWPDSFYRFYKLIPMLTDPASYGGDQSDSFDVVVPSFPNFGFSDIISEPGWHLGKNASLFHKLMTEELGYDRYFAQGGDGGSTLAQTMAVEYPKAVLAIHLTDIGYHNSLSAETPNLSEAEQKQVEEEQWSGMQESAYALIQGTKPQSLAYGLNDSPAGLAGWIIEKFQSWSDNDGDIEQTYTKDELLTNLTIYWVTQTINAANRGYREGMQGEGLAPWTRVEVPVGLAIFPKDHPPLRETAERALNIQHWTEMAKGGHFAALEQPESLADDLREFLREYRG
jgi:pimeloyl-ACP methyl ester carboxylesterase